jgi:hypothetical protein
MPRKSLIEEILEVAFKNHIAGIISSLIFACGGFYLTNKSALVGAKPADVMFIPLEHMLGSFFYILSVAVLFFSGIGYTVNSIKKKKQTPLGETRRRKDMDDLLKNPIDLAAPTSNVPRFRTKEEYLRWKDSVMMKSSDNNPAVAAPQNRRADIIDLPHQMDAPKQEQDEAPAIRKEEAAWTLDSIYDALGKIDWYQFEKFSAALLLNEGYVVERKGGAYPDGGVDLIAIKDSETILVQCKHWKTWSIKPKTVREMVGTMMINQTRKGAIYTLKGATKAAQELAIQQGIQIEEGYSLANRALRQLTTEQLDRILNTNLHHCPKCEAEMIWRRGATFKPFWGCSRYPKCFGKLKYTGAP